MFYNLGARLRSSRLWVGTSCSDLSIQILGIFMVLDKLSGCPIFLWQLELNNGNNKMSRCINTLKNTISEKQLLISVSVIWVNYSAIRFGYSLSGMTPNV